LRIKKEENSVILELTRPSYIIEAKSFNHLTSNQAVKKDFMNMKILKEGEKEMGVSRFFALVSG